MNDAQLLCRGTIRRRDGVVAVAFEPMRCAGCEGRCGIRLGKARLPLDARELADGTPVEVVANARTFGACALLVFGAPVAMAVGAALLAEQMAWGRAWLAPTALLASVLAALCARFARAGRLASGVEVERGAAGAVRIRLR